MTGGMRYEGHDNAAVREAEVYNPSTNSWIATSAAARPRNYHSVALLLPGRSRLDGQRRASFNKINYIYFFESRGGGVDFAFVFDRRGNPIGGSRYIAMLVDVLSPRSHCFSITSKPALARRGRGTP